DLVLALVGSVEVDPELIDLFELPDNRLHRARVDVRAAHQLHVVDPAPDPTFIKVKGSAARAATRRDADHQVAGPIAQHRDEAAPEGGDQPLAQLAVGNGVAGIRVDHLFDVMILDDVDPTRLPLALEDHD